MQGLVLLLLREMIQNDFRKSRGRELKPKGQRAKWGSNIDEVIWLAPPTLLSPVGQFHPSQNQIRIQALLQPSPMWVGWWVGSPVGDGINESLSATLCLCFGANGRPLPRWVLSIIVFIGNGDDHRRREEEEEDDDDDGYSIELNECPVTTVAMQISWPLP